MMDFRLREWEVGAQCLRPESSITGVSNLWLYKSRSFAIARIDSVRTGVLPGFNGCLKTGRLS